MLICVTYSSWFKKTTDEIEDITAPIDKIHINNVIER